MSKIVLNLCIGDCEFMDSFQLELDDVEYETAEKLRDMFFDYCSNIIDIEISSEE